MAIIPSLFIVFYILSNNLFKIELFTSSSIMSNSIDTILKKTIYSHVPMKNLLPLKASIVAVK